jgi:hypothetical protein
MPRPGPPGNPPPVVPQLSGSGIAVPSQVCGFSDIASVFEIELHKLDRDRQPLVIPVGPIVMPVSMPHSFWSVQQPNVSDDVPGNARSITLGTGQRGSIFGMSRQSDPDLMPQPPENGSLQHKVSRSKPAGSVQTSFAQANLLPVPVLAEEALPVEGLSLPHADITVTNPNANGHVRRFIDFTFIVTNVSRRGRDGSDILVESAARGRDQPASVVFCPNVRASAALVDR